MKEDFKIGKIVYSKAGRDSSKFYIIVGIKNDQYVYITDGSLRKVEKPKMKKVKHLQLTSYLSEEVNEVVLSGDKLSNSTVKRILESYVSQ